MSRRWTPARRAPRRARPPARRAARRGNRRARRRPRGCRARGRCAPPPPCPLPLPHLLSISLSLGCALPPAPSPCPSPPPSLPRVMSSRDDGPPFSAPARMLRCTRRPSPSPPARPALFGGATLRGSAGQPLHPPIRGKSASSPPLFRMAGFAAATCAENYGNLLLAARESRIGFDHMDRICFVFL